MFLGRYWYLFVRKSWESVWCSKRLRGVCGIRCSWRWRIHPVARNSYNCRMAWPSLSRLPYSISSSIPFGYYLSPYYYFLKYCFLCIRGLEATVLLNNLTLSKVSLRFSTTYYSRPRTSVTQRWLTARSGAGKTTGTGYDSSVSVGLGTGLASDNWSGVGKTTRSSFAYTPQISPNVSLFRLSQKVSPLRFMSMLVC